MCVCVMCVCDVCVCDVCVCECVCVCVCVCVCDVCVCDVCVGEQGVHDPWRRRGEATAVVASDYYNRHISAWEPILEPWRYGNGTRSNNQLFTRGVSSLLLCSLTLIWEKEAQYSTDLDTSKPQGRMYLRLTCENEIILVEVG